MSILKSIKSVGGARGKRLSAIATVAGATAALLVAASAGTGAGWTATTVTPVPSSPIASAVFNLSANLTAGTNIALDGMIPGDKKIIAITTENKTNGTLVSTAAINYDVTASFGGTAAGTSATDLGKFLSLGVYPDLATAQAGTTPTFTPVKAAHNQTAAVFTNRPLASQGSEKLYYVVTFEPDAGSTWMGKTASLVVSFNADQQRTAGSTTTS